VSVAAREAEFKDLRDARAVALVCILLALCAATCNAQELTPRAYWPAPHGTKVGVLGYARASGDVLFDASTPLYGVDSQLESFVFAYLQTVSLFGRTANFVLELPYIDGSTSGLIVDIPVSGEYSGVGDISATLSVNLLGAPSMSREEYVALRASPHTILGASVKVVFPTGKYDPNRLLNTSAGRWAVNPELGLMLPLSPKWVLELELGAWFFGDDGEFIAGRREQDPIVSGEVHLIRRIRPGLWASIEANHFVGGRQTVAGTRLEDVQDNSRFGATLAIPLKGRSSIKLSYAFGVTTSFGTDFDQFLVSYQVLLN
jgi:hypothetical protein